MIEEQLEDFASIRAVVCSVTSPLGVYWIYDYWLSSSIPDEITVADTQDLRSRVYP